jgi:succinyl-CoA synthetase beta subunit
MFLHEFQAKELLARFGVAIPRGRIAGSAEDAEIVSRRLGFAKYAVKAQVRAGGREQAGGVRFADDPVAVGRVARDLIGQRLFTAQTGPFGRRINWVYIEEAIFARRLLYLCVAVDPTIARIVLLVSGEGGRAIEQRAHDNRATVHRRPIEPANIDHDPSVAILMTEIGLKPAIAGEVARMAALLARMLVRLDATLIEINPLAVTTDDHLVALDAKIIIDDNSLFRHGDLAELRRLSEEEDGDPAELQAQSHQINYITLDGDIAIAVNGAGLALATLDLVRDAGGRPANFMDIRTTASSLDIAAGFDLILANPRVRVLLVNVHGGGMQRCDTIIEGLGVAMRRTNRHCPLIVRLAGNNADFARARLTTYGVAYEEGSNMWDAAQRAARLAASKVV